MAILTANKSPQFGPNSNIVQIKNSMAIVTEIEEKQQKVSIAVVHNMNAKFTTTKTCLVCSRPKPPSLHIQSQTAGNVNWVKRTQQIAGNAYFYRMLLRINNEYITSLFTTNCKLRLSSRFLSFWRNFTTIAQWNINL